MSGPGVGWFSLSCRPDAFAQPDLSPSSCPREPTAPGKLPYGSRGTSNTAPSDLRPLACPCSVVFLEMEHSQSLELDSQSHPELLPLSQPHTQSMIRTLIHSTNIY